MPLDSLVFTANFVKNIAIWPLSLLGHVHVHTQLHSVTHVHIYMYMYI